MPIQSLPGLLPRLREWFSKQNYEGGIDQAKAGRFVHTAFAKIRKELRRRRDADG
jgi:hypothetical protein